MKLLESKEEQVSWCCQHKHLHCGASQPFNCAEGLGNAEKGWSPHKKTFCCKEYGVACEKEADEQSEQADEQSEDEQIEDEQSEDEQSEDGDWDIEAPYDCTAGFGNWKRGWSVHKKEYCCGKYQLGCERDEMLLGAIPKEAFAGCGDFLFDLRLVDLRVPLGQSIDQVDGSGVGAWQRLVPC